MALIWPRRTNLSVPHRKVVIPHRKVVFQYVDLLQLPFPPNQDEALQNPRTAPIA